MTSMKKIKNISKETQSVTGIGRFIPGEERDVSDRVFSRLSRNPNFSEAKKPKKDIEQK